MTRKRRLVSPAGTWAPVAAVVLAFAASALSPAPCPSPTADPPAPDLSPSAYRLSPDQMPPFDLAILNARVIHGDGRVTSKADVFVRGGRIALIEAAGARGTDGPAPRAHETIDANGRTLLPGLIDAHVHADAWTLPVFLKHGVTTVRDLHGDAERVFRLAAEDSPSRPRVITSGPLIDGAGSVWKNAVEISTVGEARAAVRRQVEQGARVIKVYTRLEPPLLSVIVSEARARGVPVAAHLGRTNAKEAAEAGITSLEHLSGVSDAASDDPARMLKAHDDFLGGWTAFEDEWRRIPLDRLEAVARHLIAHHVVIVPTLALHEAFSRMADADLMKDPMLADVPPQILKDEWAPGDIMGRAKWTAATLAGFKQTLPTLQHFVATYARLGGRIAAGTDTPQQFVVPGHSLHRELELYVASGLSPAQALATATINAAALLGIQDEAGFIDVGKVADLILLDADPLADIRNTRKICLVVRSGRIVR